MKHNDKNLSDETSSLSDETSSLVIIIKEITKDENETSWTSDIAKTIELIKNNQGNPLSKFL